MTAYKATRTLTPDEIRFIENVLPKLIYNDIMGSCIFHNICIGDDDFNGRILSEYVDDDAMDFNEDTEVDDKYGYGSEQG